MVESQLTLVFLSEHLGQIHRHVDCLLPRRRVKAELWRLPSLGDGGQLEKVSGDDDLDAPKGFVGSLAEHLADLAQLVKQVRIDHGDWSRQHAASLWITSRHSPSSMINTFVLSHLAAAFLFRLILPTSTSGDSRARPTPPNE